MNKKNMKEYRAWKGMKARCYSPCNSKTTYQMNDIKVCDEWVNSFDRFLLDMGLAPSINYSVERVDNSLGYCKSNCTWATQGEQTKNRGSFNNVFTHNGESKVLKDWATHFGINYTTLHMRIFRSGISFEDAIKKDPFNRMVEIGGEGKTCKDWCKSLNIDYRKVIDRVRRRKTSHKTEILKLIKE